LISSKRTRAVWQTILLASRKAFIDGWHHRSPRIEWGLFMRMVIALSFLALLAAGVTAFGTETVSVGSDFGAAWLASQPERISTNNGGGLWTWGGTPTGMKVVNGSLVPEEEDDEEIDYDDIGWLGTEFQGTPLKLNLSNVTSSADFLNPFSSTDPWVLSQHYEMPILVPADYYD
jgi:hypothetical protein